MSAACKRLPNSEFKITMFWQPFIYFKISRNFAMRFYYTVFFIWDIIKCGILRHYHNQLIN